MKRAENFALIGLACVALLVLAHFMGWLGK